jgi:hypothetical protein
MRSHDVHSFSTSGKIACAHRETLIQKGIYLKFCRLHTDAAKNTQARPEENSNYCEVFLSGRSKTYIPNGSLPINK